MKIKTLQHRSRRLLLFLLLLYYIHIIIFIFISYLDTVDKTFIYCMVQVVEALLQAGADPDVQAQNGSTAMHNAAANGHDAVAESLIAAASDVDVQNSGGNTALHVAASKGTSCSLLDVTRDALEPIQYTFMMRTTACLDANKIFTISDMSFRNGEYLVCVH